MTKDRWVALMRAFGFTSCIETYNSLVIRYSEKHRFYHTTQHIDAMLKHLDNVIELANHPAELELAIWFHDAIYQPFSGTNELDSANWAVEFLNAQGYGADGVNRVHKMIMATLHDGDASTIDEQLLVDIDLTILGAPTDVYDQFEINVRNEYRKVPSFIFRSKRKQILQSFLNADSVYRSTYFKDRFEQSARQNLSRAIAALSK